jgi:hypothetical protein
LLCIAFFQGLPDWPKEPVQKPVTHLNCGSLNTGCILSI